MKNTAPSPTLPVACFAPDLTDKVLAKYREMIMVCPYGAETRDALLGLLVCVEKWWDLPVSTRDDVVRWQLVHTGKMQHIEVIEQPMDDELVQELWDVTPWMSELDRLSNPHDSGLFDHLEPGEYRNMAFHLLWHVKEITLDREPMTAATAKNAKELGPFDPGPKKLKQ